MVQVRGSSPLLRILRRSGELNSTDHIRVLFPASLPPSTSCESAPYPMPYDLCLPASQLDTCGCKLPLTKISPHFDRPAHLKPRHCSTPLRVRPYENEPVTGEMRVQVTFEANKVRACPNCRRYPIFPALPRTQLSVSITARLRPWLPGRQGFPTFPTPLSRSFRIHRLATCDHVAISTTAAGCFTLLFYPTLPPARP